MPSCCVPNCKSIADVTFSFPNEPDLRQRWIESMGLDGNNTRITVDSRICACHFDSADLVVHRGRQRRKPGALPRLILNGGTADIAAVKTEPESPSPPEDTSITEAIAVDVKPVIIKVESLDSQQMFQATSSAAHGDLPICANSATDQETPQSDSVCFSRKRISASEVETPAKIPAIQYERWTDYAVAEVDGNHIPSSTLVDMPLLSPCVQPTKQPNATGHNATPTNQQYTNMRPATRPTATCCGSPDCVAVEKEGLELVREVDECSHRISLLRHALDETQTTLTLAEGRLLQVKDLKMRGDSEADHCYFCLGPKQAQLRHLYDQNTLSKEVLQKKSLSIERECEVMKTLLKDAPNLFPKLFTRDECEAIAYNKIHSRSN